MAFFLAARFERTGDTYAIFMPNQNWKRTIEGPGGMVGRHLGREARKVARIAKPLAGKDTGLLRRSIKAGTVVDGPAGPMVDVTAHAPYALYHHEGTKPYTKTVMTRRGPMTMSHPGKLGNPFLMNALVFAGYRPRPR